MNGHDLLGHPGDALDAADDDHADAATAKTRPKSQPGVGEEAVVATGDGHDLRGGLVGLEHVAAAERAADAEDRRRAAARTLPRPPMPRSASAVAQVVHRPAGDGAVGVLAAVLHAERALGELRRHAEEAGDDHPEGRAGTAERDGDGDAGDVAEPDRARHRRGQRLEVARPRRRRPGWSTCPGRGRWHARPRTLMKPSQTVKNAPATTSQTTMRGTVAPRRRRSRRRCW